MKQGEVILVDFELGSPIPAKIRRDKQRHDLIIRKLKHYWSNLGYEINFRLEFYEETSTFEIRSDLVNGLPPKNLNRRTRTSLAVQ